MHVCAHRACVLQYKELEAELKGLKEQRDAAQRESDQEGQRILSLEANLSQADEKRRSLRKQLAEVSTACIDTGGRHAACTVLVTGSNRQPVTSSVVIVLSTPEGCPLSIFPSPIAACRDD